MERPFVDSVRDSTSHHGFEFAIDPALEALSVPQSKPGTLLTGDAAANSEVALVQQFSVEGAEADEILGYGDDDEELEGVDNAACGGDEDEDLEDVPTTFKAFQTSVRVDAVKRAEGNRRAGGLRMQKAMVRVWNEFVQDALCKKTIQDDIVDEHSLLLYIKYTAEQPKRTRKGIDIPGTFVGASQLKKQFFGALRIRKEQEARDPSLIRQRPATSVIVWDAIKNRMDEALERVRNGLVPNEDAPDIIANTFLAEVTEMELDRASIAFLQHHELRSVIYGHLTWNAQHATGNRGDDFRALKISELQPYMMRHPQFDKLLFTVLGLQGEEKAGKRGMRTIVNPTYSVFMTHERPEKCPLGALAFYKHYIHDVKDLTSTVGIDWSVNKSWRKVRILHGAKSPTTPYNEQSLYNLYAKAFAKAGFTSRLKAHLPRHLLGYRQERLGVDERQTQRMGWRRGETYADTYAPSLAKSAILSTHGYKEDEDHDPVWRHVEVPSQFFSLVCPMAESILEDIKGKPNLKGTTFYWEMIISLRPYLFQCGAAIHQLCPESALFKLPALANKDVHNWMVGTYPSVLCLLKAKAGEPVDMRRVQNKILRVALQEFRCLQTTHNTEIKKLAHLVDRRTAVLSPTKGFSTSAYAASSACPSASVDVASYGSLLESLPSRALNFSLTPPSPTTDLGGVYISDDSSLRAFVSSSPKTSTGPQTRTQIDLVLPPSAAFTKPGSPSLIWPPVLGQCGVGWDTVFALVHQPSHLWDCWRPSKSLNEYREIKDLWVLYTLGEPVYNTDGVKTGVKPPLQLVEQYFGSKWRPGETARKTWECIREIPEWIVIRACDGISPALVVDELEQMRGGDEQGKGKKGMNAFAKDVKVLCIQHIQRLKKAPAPNSSDNSTLSPSPTIVEKKRRARPLEPRKRAKNQKLH